MNTRDEPVMNPVRVVGDDCRQRFERDVTVHIPALTRVAIRRLRQREMAEDAVQETLLRAWRHFDQLRDAAAVAPWLFMILRNECARVYRKAPPPGAGIDVEALPGADQAVDTDGIDLRRSVETLPAQYRRPLELFAFEGRAVDEIAVTLGLERATVKTRLFRARGRLRDRMAPALSVGHAGSADGTRVASAAG